MIVGMSIGIATLGVLLMVVDMFAPIPLMLNLMLRIMGIGFFAIGIMILGARITQTGVGPFLEIPNTKRVILMHQRRGHNPNTNFLIGKLDDLEFIRTRNKIFKDTGGGFRIAGHDVRRTHELISPDIPEWLSQYFYQVKHKYGITNGQKYRELRQKLQQLRPPLPGMDLEDQLRMIEILKPIMDNPTKKEVLVNMDLKSLQNMSELIFDGEVHHGEEVEEFIESATPNELSVLEKQKFLNEKMEEKHYKDVGEINWGAWVGPMLILLVGGAIAVAIIAGVFQ